MMNVVLNRFMIFDPNEGQDEGREQDKLLYHWTKDAANYGKIELSEQIDDVCLCDASISTSIRLNSDLNLDQAIESELLTECQNSSLKDASVHSLGRDLVLTFDSTVIVIVEVEPKSSVWIAVFVSQSVPLDSSEVVSAANSVLDSESILTDAIKQIIENIYDRFCLINGTFQMINAEINNTDRNGEISDEGRRRASNREKIRSICDNYFNNVLPEIHLSSIISNAASLYNYLIYLDLNPLTLMKVTSFINHLVCIDPNQIRHTIAIFNDRLLWSSLNMHDSRLVYNYMVGVLIRDALQEELSKETEKVRRIKENMTLYLTEDPEECHNLEESMSAINIQQLGNNKRIRKLSRFYLTVFRSSNNMTLGLIFKDPDQFDIIHKCEQILTSDTRLGVIPLASLAKSVGQNFLRANSLGITSLQANHLGATNSAPSSSRRRQGSVGNSLSSKSSIPYDQNYLCIDRLDASLSSSFSIDAQARDHHPPMDNYNPETTTSSRKSRLIKYLIDFEPEMQDIQSMLLRRVEEYLVKTISDTWLTVMNSKYRCIYSVYKMRNAGLHEAQQAANNLKSTLVSSRP